MMTRFKIMFIYSVIALGLGVIIWWQWPEAMKSHGIGAGYEQSTGASIYLAVLMTGIPALLYAVAVYVSLTHWLLRPGELKAYRARWLAERILTMPKSTAKSSAPVRNYIMWLLIAVGVTMIFLDAWRRVDARDASEGVVTETLMLIIMGGIPSIAFAGVVSVAFRFLFGAPSVTPPPNAEVSKKQANARPGSHDFID
jgi:hypothetical protein